MNDFMEVAWREKVTLPTKHWTSNRRADHVYIRSLCPWPILYIYLTAKLGPLFGCQTVTQLGRHIAVQHFTFEPGTFFGRHLDGAWNAYKIPLRNVTSEWRHVCHYWTSNSVHWFIESYFFMDSGLQHTLVPPFRFPVLITLCLTTNIYSRSPQQY